MIYPNLSKADRGNYFSSFILYDSLWCSGYLQLSVHWLSNRDHPHAPPDEKYV